MAEPTAALAVARMMAMAATSTRSDRDNASVCVLIIEKFDSFRLWVSLGLSGFVYFASPFRAPSRLAMRCCYFDYAGSISRRPSKVPNGHHTPHRGETAFASEMANRQMKIIMKLTQPHWTPDKPAFSRIVRTRFMAFLCQRLTPPAPQPNAQLARGRVNRRHNPILSRDRIGSNQDRRHARRRCRA